MPSVSTLLPFRNAAATLDTAIASMAAQTFGDQELLLIDNASTDGSTAIAQHWAARDARITLVHEPHVGIAHALNTGLAHARGSLIARMDADDVSHPERLAKQVAHLEAHPDIGVLGTATRFASTVPEHRGMLAYVAWQNRILSPDAHAVKRFVDAPLAHPTVMFRRALVERHGGYDTGPVPEDHELWLRWMDAGVRLAKLPEALLTWNDQASRVAPTPRYSADAFCGRRCAGSRSGCTAPLGGRPVIVAGTSALCRERAQLLAAEGIPVAAFTDVKPRSVPGHAFVPSDALPPAGEAFVVSLISQRGAGDRIAAFLAGRGLVEGEDFVLAA